MVQFDELLQKICEERRTASIDGWGLQVPARLWGKLVDTSPSQGCSDSECLHLRHDPAAPYRRWIPKEGDKLAMLGVEVKEDVTLTWYVLRRREGEYVFLLRSRPSNSWARVCVVSRDDVPQWVLDRAKELL